MSKKLVKFCTDFFMVLISCPLVHDQVIRILILAVLNKTTYEMKILNYCNYSLIPDLFNHHGVNAIVKCRMIHVVAYTFCMKLVRLADV